MRKYYFILFFLTSLVSKAQFVPYPYADLMSWDTSPFESYKFSDIPFRLMFPNNYDSQNPKKYPIIVFFHGSGERGTNNELQLLHGGLQHRDAVLSGRFPGFLLYPQNDASGNWGTTWLVRVKNVVDELIENYNVDPNRIYIHGLSGGGEASWQFATLYPQLVAAMAPMSGAASTFLSENYKHIPIWLTQGGLDRAPSPDMGNFMVYKIRDEYGSNIRYSYYTDLGHATWNRQYNRSDFFEWFTPKHKTDITVFHGRTDFCQEDPINVKLGVTAGFSNYEWVKDDTLSMPIETGVNEITVEEPGKYFVRFVNRGVMTKWSKPADINRNQPPSPQPSISANGQSVNLPTLAGVQSVLLSGPADRFAYQWEVDGSTISGATDFSYSASDAGVYALRSREPGESEFESDGITPTEYRPDPIGCFSDPSNSIIVTTQNGINVPAKPSNFFVNVLSASSIVINWNDESNNELAFELYRATTSGSGYSLVEVIPSDGSGNPKSYIDAGLSPNKTYYYRMRAVNNDGGSTYTLESEASTFTDNEPPSAPILSVSGTGQNHINLKWTASSDNSGILEYEIYRNNVLIATVTGTEYSNSDLPVQQMYSYVVKARDLAGNESFPSNQVTAATVPSGLTYRYYHHNNFSSTTQIESNGTLVSTGNTNNFNISIRTRNDRFAFVWEGYVNIQNAGSYTFYTDSDDGSRLYINGIYIVNNDGAHGCRERNGSVTLPVGYAHIKVYMFENGGGECLTVEWRGPGVSKQLIPDNVLYESIYNYPQPPAIPSNLTAVADGYDKVDLTWNDNSQDENNFEISRSVNISTGYTLVYLAEPGENTWSDIGLSGGTTYYYRIRSINLNGESDYEGPVSVTTAAYPAAPSTPTNLQLGINEFDKVLISWDDVSYNESGFEIYRTTEVSGSYTLIHTAEPDAELYIDEEVYGNSSYYYKIRARGTGTNSDFSPVISITTPNNPPVIADILNRSVKFGSSQQLNISAEDPDGDPITFSFNTPDPLPAFISFDQNGFGSGQLTFEPTLSDEDIYTFEVVADDGSGGIDQKSFVITVSNNNNPEISPIDNVVMDEGFSSSVNISVFDNESFEDVVLSAEGLPPFIAFYDYGYGSGVFIINSPIGSAGTYRNIKLIADDGEGGFAEEYFDVIIHEVEQFYSLGVNFTPNVNLTAPGWNTAATNISSLSDLVTFTGEVTNLNLSLCDGCGSSAKFNRGGVSNLESGLYPDNVKEPFVFRGQQPVTMRLQNLNPSLFYKLTFFSGLDAEYNHPDYGVTTLPKRTIFTIQGSTQVLDAHGNSFNTVSFENIQPDGNNEIIITFNKVGSDPYYVLNSMYLDVYANDGNPPVAPGSLVLNAVSTSSIEMSWQDNSNNELGFEIYRSSDSPTGPFVLAGTTVTNQTSFTDENLEPSTLYYYKIRAINSNGSGETPVGLVTTLNSPPALGPVNNQMVTAGQQLIISINATDPEGNSIALSASGLPAFAAFTDFGDGSGQITLIPGIEDEGNYGNITITATDNFSSSGNTSFLLTVVEGQYEEVVHINFGINSTASLPWNNLNTNPSSGQSFNNLIDGNGNPTSVDLQVGNGWSGGGDDGPSSGNNSYLYEDLVTKGYWRISNTGTGNLTIAGLDPSKVYALDIFASAAEWDVTWADYNVNGQIITAHSNNKFDEVLVYSKVTPNGAGEIAISITGKTHTINSYINALVVKEHNPATIIKPTDFKAEGKSRQTIKLTWTDNSFNETGFEILRSSEPGAPFHNLITTGPDVTSYEDNGYPSNTAFIYKIRAINGNGASSYTDEISAATLDHIVYININPPPDLGAQASAPWNNTSSLAQPNTFGNFLDEEGNATPEELKLEFFTGGSYNVTGTQTGNDSGIYPDEVLEGYYYWNDVDPQGEFRITNLPLDMSYDLEFFGTENQYTQDEFIGITEFIVESDVKMLFTDYNLTETVKFYGVNPELSNSIEFQVQASASNGARWGFFNAMVIKVYRSPDAIFDKIAPSIPTELVVSDITDNSVTLNWSGSSDNVGLKGYEIFKGGEMVGFSNSESFGISNLDPGFTYSLTVRAVDKNNNYSGFSIPMGVTTTNSSPIDVFYYQGGNITNTSSWKPNPGGGGPSPSSFTEDNQHFILQSNGNLNSGWIISGSSSKLIVNENVVFNINNTFNGTIEAKANAVINIYNNSTPDFDVLDPTSTVKFAASTNQIPVARYGNIIFASPNSIKTLLTGNLIITGTAKIEDNISILGTASGGSELSISGNITFMGSPQTSAPDDMITLNFNSGGQQEIILSPNANLSAHKINISEGTELVYNTSGTGTLSLGSATGGGLTINNDGALILDKHNLVINGEGSINPFNETGAINTRSGSITIDSETQNNSNIYFINDYDTLTELSINYRGPGQVNIHSPLNITDKLNLFEGIVNSIQVVRLISSEAKTAIIPEITNGGLISGNVESQRYMEGEGRLYRYMATPIIGTTVEDWQKYIPVTGNFVGTSVIPGVNSSESLFYYDEPAGGWIAYPEENNKQEMKVGTGYAIFVREAVNATVLKLIGPVFQGQHKYHLTSGNPTENLGWNLLGNVYPAPIYWGNSGWIRNGVGTGVQIRDNALGDFRVYDSETGIGDPGFNGNIAVGQAFWVQTISTTPELIINEPAKTEEDAPFFRTTDKYSYGYLMVTLSGMDEIDYTHILIDKEFIDSFDINSDISKKKNDQANIFTVADNVDLVINKLSDNFCQKTIPLNLSDMVAGNYTLKFDFIRNFSVDSEFTLVDNFSNNQVDLNVQNTYSFTISSNSAEISDRFEIIINKPEINTSFDLTSVESVVCSDQNELFDFVIHQTQRGVIYKPVLNENVFEEEVIGTGGSVSFSFDAMKLLSGLNEISVLAEIPGCSAKLLEKELSINGISSPIVSSDSTYYNICAGESIVITASADQEDVLFQWKDSKGDVIAENNNGTLLLDKLQDSQTIILQATNVNGCYTNESLIYNINVDVLEDFYIYEDGQLLKSSLRNGDSYQWYLNDQIIAGATSPDIVKESFGLYKVHIIKGACAGFSEDYIITGIKDGLQESYKLFPNPTKDVFRIKGVFPVNYELAIVDVLGNDIRGVVISKIDEDTVQVDLTQFRSGVYLIYIKNKTESLVFRIIKI